MGTRLKRGEVVIMPISPRLAELYRQATRGLKRSEVLALTGLTNTTLERIQQGQTSLGRDKLLLFAKGLDLNVRQVFEAAFGERVEPDGVELVQFALQHSPLSASRRVRVVRYYRQMVDEQAAEEEKQKVA